MYISIQNKGIVAILCYCIYTEYMGIFIKKKTSIPLVEYNPEKERPVLKCSICNGEQIAGFKDKQTGHFTEVILIRNGQDLDEFMEMYDLSSVTKEY